MISVIIPLYNKEAIIAHTIRSVLSQSLADFEVIVVDDGSTDGSVRVAEGFHDERIRLIRQENGGPGAARNTGVKNAKGEWVLFLDADDELAEGALEHLANKVHAHPEASVIDGSFSMRRGSTETQTLYEEDQLVKNNYQAYFFGKTMPSTGHTLFKAELVKKYPYSTVIRRYEDVDLIMRIMKEAKIVTTSKIIFYVNTAYSSASSARKTIQEDFLGYLDFRGKSFWEKMSLYQLYLWERDHYPQEVDHLYPTLRRRYDWFFLYKVLTFLKKHYES